MIRKRLILYFRFAMQLAHPTLFNPKFCGTYKPKVYTGTYCTVPYRLHSDDRFPQFARSPTLNKSQLDE